MELLKFTVDIRRILDELADDIAVDQPITLPTFVLGDEVFEPVGDAVPAVTLTNTGAGVVAMGAIAARFSTTCVRCLEPLCIDISAEVEGFYVLPRRAAQIPDEQEYELIRDGRTIDLGSAIEAAIALELPFAPVHDPACSGICPACGGEPATCGCGSDNRESPFAKLKEMLGEPD
jgi:uncharacterized protein